MPIQEGVILQRTKVRVPSPFMVFLGHSMAGVLGGVGAALAMEALQRTTRISPGVRAGIVAGGGLFAGGLVARNSPRLGTGVFVGGIAASIPSVIEAVETWSAVREAPPTAVIEQPAAPATTPAPSPAPGVATAPSAGVLSSGSMGSYPAGGGGVFVMQQGRPNVLLEP